MYLLVCLYVYYERMCTTTEEEKLLLINQINKSEEEEQLEEMNGMDAYFISIAIFYLSLFNTQNKINVLI